MVINSCKIKQRGFLLLEVIMAILLTQIIFFYAFPSLKQLYKHISAVTYLNHLRLNIEWTRWQAILSNKELQFLPYQNQWSKGWLIIDNAKVIRRSQPFLPVPVNVSWHGFKEQLLNFYPNMTHNHVNGYFQVMNMRLILNRYGHSRIKYGV